MPTQRLRTTVTAMTILLGIAGSLRRRSLNRRLLRAAARELPTGARLITWDGLADLPPFDEDGEEPAPPAVDRLRAAVRAADALLFATPEYNASVPGVLKNAVDWASRPYGASVLMGRRAAVIGAGPGPVGAAGAQADLIRVLERAGVEVVGGPLPVPAAFRAFDESDRLLDPTLRAELASVLAEALTEVHQPTSEMTA
jgi:chromate reductase